MGIIACASGTSCWRGLDYYKHNKVKNIKVINDMEYSSVVTGNKEYKVYLNLSKVRRSTCNCPLPNEKRIICKHIVATYFSVVPNSANDFEKEQESLQKEYEEYQDNEYKNAVKFIKTK